jgi:hypothetical protein
LPQVSGDKDGANEVPQPIHNIYVSIDIPPELSEGTNAVHKQTDRPQKLIRFPAGKILVENSCRENEAHDARDERNICHIFLLARALFTQRPWQELYLIWLNGKTFSKSNLLDKHEK